MLHIAQHPTSEHLKLTNRR